jgi:site-specific recombinase XerD
VTWDWPRPRARDEGPARVRDAALIPVLHAYGLRRAEVVALDLADYDADGGDLIVRGKGNRERNLFLDNGAFDALADWLEERGYVQHNPAASIRKVREPKRLIAALTPDQVTALLAQPDRGLFVGLRDFCFILTLLDTGIRLSEGLDLQLERVDLEDGLARVIGKGDKERDVGFSARLNAELRIYAIKREAAMAPKAVQRRVRRYGEQAGIRGVRVSPHTLRHTYALNFVRAGGDPFTLQKVLGHTSLATTRRYCELASGDVLRRQRELSPLHTMGIKVQPGRRVPRRGMERW